MPALGAPAGFARRRCRELDVEADVEDVSVLDDVLLPLETLQAALCRLRARAALDQVVPPDHFPADEPPGDVGVDRLPRVQRGLTAPQRPRACLGVAGGEESDQIERVLQPAGGL